MSPKSEAIVILYSGCIFHEVATAVALLSDHATIKMISPDGEPVQTGEQIVITADASYASADLQHVRFLLIPGGDCDSVIENAELGKLLVFAHQHGSLIIGAICNGALVAAKSGILNGKRCTHTAHPKWAPLPEFKELLDVANIAFANTTYVDDDVVEDGQVVTAKPWATIDFALRLAQRGGLIDAKRVETLGHYYRGKRPR